MLPVSLNKTRTTEDQIHLSKLNINLRKIRKRVSLRKKKSHLKDSKNHVKRCLVRTKQREIKIDEDGPSSRRKSRWHITKNETLLRLGCQAILSKKDGLQKIKLP